MNKAQISGPDLLQIADVVAREKDLAKDLILEAMEEAIQKAGRAKYGDGYDVRAHIDRSSGDITMYRVRTVVEEVEDIYKQISLIDAKLIDAQLSIGQEIRDELPLIDFNRIAAQVAKQVINQKVRDAERQKQYEEFKDRVGEVVSGVVKKADFNSVVVEIGHGEGVLRRDGLLPREAFRVGDRIRAYLEEVRRCDTGAQILLSRTHPNFMAKLFRQEVPEIYDGVIEIKAVARDPGSRGKIAVYSRDPSIDPIGSCVGMRGVRVQAVVQELQGEKVDIVPWSEDPATFVVNALAPAEVVKVVIDPDKKTFGVVISDDQLSIAIGRRGQNVRLASQLTGWRIDISTESEDSERKNREYHEKSQMFMDALDCDDVIAHLLVAEGFNSLEELAEVDPSEVAEIEGFDKTVAKELQDRAIQFVEKRNIELKQEFFDSGGEAAMLDINGMQVQLAAKLAKSDVKTLDDLAGLASDELMELAEDLQLSQEIADAIILKAREPWFAQAE
ncbi:MAG: transcription termination factor NusA [Holosporales bacterium]|jgi:N utilization substance protein A|nr:transcription termination factor NusA [Holosporales bacterium]